MDANERYTKKMLRKLEAHLKGKRTKVTYPNPNDKMKNLKWITVSGMDFWGDPKARPSEAKS